MWVVWENMNNEYWRFESEAEARNHYEDMKDHLMGEEVSGEEQVWIFKAEKKAVVVEDAERTRESALEYGFDFWVTWKEEKI